MTEKGMIDIEQYPLVKLTDVSKILSSVGFIRVYRKSADHSEKVVFIHCPEVYDPAKMEFVIEEVDGFVKGFAILPNSMKVNNEYLTSILNSYVSWAFITDGRIEDKTTVTIRKLSNIAVRVLPEHLQKAVAYLHYLIIDTKSQKESGSNNPYLDYWISVYKEVLNAIALELIMPQMYKDYEIDMLGSWCRLIGKCFKDDQGVTLDQLEEELGKELLTPQNAVVGNTKKLRVVMRKIAEHVTGQA